MCVVSHLMVVPGRKCAFQTEFLNSPLLPDRSSPRKIPGGLEAIRGDVAGAVAGASICSGSLPGGGAF